ncbi:CD225/dispanin family protein [Rhodococcus spelaei]|uniref:CD225/dispanin family protein n=1 Tax=Rhodococcus spelaei TaxID=2546320 RepID=A0A541BMR0_9NOCA|nr:CD225/dispanin family protein [Rhodococcus spelaei]TQF73613.1 CD225/dispanin family protein [Rhodococcus spelaei]
MTSPTDDSPSTGSAPSAPTPPPGPTGPPAYPARPPSNAGWAVASLLFFWPLAFSAFTHAFEVYPLWAGGDPRAAQDASDRVRRLGQLSLWLFGALLVLFAIVYTIVALVVITHGGDDEMFRHHRMRM